MSEEKKRTDENPAVSSSSAENPPQSSSAVVGPDMRALSKDMFTKTAAYLQGEFEATSEDYRLLENMNKTVTQRYSDMKQVSKNVAKSLAELNEKYSNLQPYLDQIDVIDESSRKLEEAAYALDAYVKSLENKFKHLEKKS